MRKHFLTAIICTIGLLNVQAQEINQYDENGKRHGVWKKYFDGTKELRYQGQFDHGKEVGEFKFYKLVKKKSILTATKMFEEDGTAQVRFLASTGKTISEGKMVGKLYIGKWIYYHNKNDNVMTVEHYNNKGKLEGERLVYYKDGVVAERANYRNGLLEGKYFGYSVKGVALRELNYKNDELHGVAKHFDGKGELLAVGTYTSGKKTGKWKYYENGKLTKEDNVDVIKKKKKQ